LGSRYEVMLPSIKKYCVGLPIQLPLEELLLIMKEHQIRAHHVERVVARLDERGVHTVNNREMPDINLQYIFAVTLLDGDLSFEAAHSTERMRDPEVLALMARVSLVAEPDLGLAFPRRQAIVEVTTKDGYKIQKQVATFRGIAEDPLSTEEVEKKAVALMEPVLGIRRTQQFIEAIGRLETLAKVQDLCLLLQV
jgi:2-methylcitrate dehydratase PrpD